VVGGLGFSVIEVARWRAKGFGPLDLEETMRVVILAAVALTLGVQTIFASFFLSVLGLTVRLYGEDPAK
jgi:hypothetical protein